MAYIHKSPFEEFSFHAREYDSVAPISKIPITLRWKQVKQYMATFIGGSAEQITVPILYGIKH